MRGWANSGHEGPLTLPTPGQGSAAPHRLARPPPLASPQAATPCFPTGRATGLSSRTESARCCAAPRLRQRGRRGRCQQRRAPEARAGLRQGRRHGQRAGVARARRVHILVISSRAAAELQDLAAGPPACIFGVTSHTLAILRAQETTLQCESQFVPGRFLAQTISNARRRLRIEASRRRR